MSAILTTELVEADGPLVLLAHHRPVRLPGGSASASPRSTRRRAARHVLVHDAGRGCGPVPCFGELDAMNEGITWNYWDRNGI